MSEFPSSLPGIDVASALARLGGNEKLYAKLLRKVAGDAPVIQERLSSAMVQGDAAGAREAAHSLKGAALNLSLVRIAEIAAKMEEAAIAEDFSLMFGYLDALEEALGELVGVVEGLE